MQSENVVKSDFFFFGNPQISWIVIRTCARLIEQPSNLKTMIFIVFCICRESFCFSSVFLVVVIIEKLICTFSFLYSCNSTDSTDVYNIIHGFYIIKTMILSKYNHLLKKTFIDKSNLLIPVGGGQFRRFVPWQPPPPQAQNLSTPLVISVNMK